MDLLPFFLLLLITTNPLSITTATSLPTSPPPSSSLPPPTTKSPLRPSIPIVVGVITTMFSITFLLLLYAKHCRRGRVITTTSSYTTDNNNNRKNSGIDRTIIESLPVFRFGSLSGQKDGLECAVCLNQFDSTEVLRLLPKCKHAFHVECVDTWLDAHSTCPLCRYRVDPEDILLLGSDNHQILEEVKEVEVSGRRISGRHSSAGEKGSVASAVAGGGRGHRRSLDILPVVALAVGCVDKQHRKDGMLLAAAATEAETPERRLEHRIIISAPGRAHYRWSDVQPSDLLYLRSEMIISDSSRRFSGVMGSRPLIPRQQNNYNNNNNNFNNNCKGINEGYNGWWQRQRWRWWRNGRNVINTRSMSEITGLSRFRGSNEGEVEGAVESRWLAWRSTQMQPAVNVSGRPSIASSSSVA